MCSLLILIFDVDIVVLDLFVSGRTVLLLGVELGHLALLEQGTVLVVNFDGLVHFEGLLLPTVPLCPEVGAAPDVGQYFLGADIEIVLGVGF